MAEGWGVIEHIEIEGFKSLEKVSLDLGPLNIFVVTNASGKTNFLEALRVLQGIGYGYTVDEILNGRPRLGNTEAWEGIRGGSRFASFLRAESGGGPIHFHTTTLTASSGRVDYIVDISSREGAGNETVSVGGHSAEFSLLLNSDEFHRFDPTTEPPELIEARRSVREHFGNTQFLRPQPEIMRDYSKDRTAYRLGDRGEDFAALINTIKRDDAACANYTAWLKELTPTELDDVDVLKGAKNDLLFGVKKDGVTYPATVLSDGTLRFAAIAAAFFQPEPPQLLMLEEIEDGLHPTRLQLLVELLKSQAGRRVKQVIATTHSPYTIAWLNEEDYRHVFLFTRNEETGATSIKPFSEVPHLVELAREQPISDLFAEGWLETAV